MRLLKHLIDPRTCGCGLLSVFAAPFVAGSLIVLAVWLGQPLIPGLPAGYGAEMCVAVATVGLDFVSVEAHWEPPGQLRSRPWAPHLCGFLPWTPALPGSGKVIYVLHTR